MTSVTRQFAGETLPALNLGQSAKAVVAGYNYACALLVDGVVKCWGLNRSGILGPGDIKNRGDNPGEVLRKVNLGEGRTVLALAGGVTHACAPLEHSPSQVLGR